MEKVCVCVCVCVRERERERESARTVRAIEYGTQGGDDFLHREGEGTEETEAFLYNFKTCGGHFGLPLKDR